MTPTGVPLVTFDPTVTIDDRRPYPPHSGTDYDSESDDGHSGGHRKRWYHYAPLAATVLLILLPHPSLLYLLIHWHLLALHTPIFFTAHVFVIYTLTFSALSYLLVLAVRDPGPVPVPATKDADVEGESMSLRDALLSPEDDYLVPGRWCRVCWAPKPERTHHCSSCGRCILKMDHHCPWIGGKCVGHRTYPAFIYFLGSITLLALYTSTLAVRAFLYEFSNPLALTEQTSLHTVFLAIYSIPISLIIGSFFAYHIYLILTNQTTIENISPFLLLRLLPPLPPTSRLSSPPLEHELSHVQRRLLRGAHGSIRPYDLGWRRNLASVFGSGSGAREFVGEEKGRGAVKSGRWRWAVMSLKGCGKGDGRTWEKNQRAEEMLARLAQDLVKLDDEGAR